VRASPRTPRPRKSGSWSPCGRRDGCGWNWLGFITRPNCGRRSSVNRLRWNPTAVRKAAARHAVAASCLELPPIWQAANRRRGRNPREITFRIPTIADFYTRFLPGCPGAASFCWRCFLLPPFVRIAVFHGPSLSSVRFAVMADPFSPSAPRRGLSSNRWLIQADAFSFFFSPPCGHGRQFWWFSPRAGLTSDREGAAPGRHSSMTLLLFPPPEMGVLLASAQELLDGVPFAWRELEYRLLLAG